MSRRARGSLHGAEPIPRPSGPARAGRSSAAATTGSASGESSAPPRPPPGAPTVRPSVGARVEEAPAPREAVESMTEGVLLISQPDGSTCLDITLSDSVFERLVCRVEVHDGRVVAIFRVRDTNLRRLLDAESGRLRTRLERRGLRVEEVRVELE